MSRKANVRSVSCTTSAGISPATMRQNGQSVTRRPYKAPTGRPARRRPGWRAPVPPPPEVSRARTRPPRADVVSTRRVARSGGPDALLPPLSRRSLLAGTGVALAAAVTGCGRSAASAPPGPLHVGAIPDQDPEVLQRLYGTVADAVSAALDLEEIGRAHV